MKLLRIPMVSLLGLVAACSGSPSGEKLDIGDRKTSVLGEKLTDYSGSWDGYAEAYQFGSGSDRVRVELDGAGNGTVEFGDMPSLGTPTDPHVAFPPVDWEIEQPGQVALPVESMALREGFTYTIAGASLQARRFRFDVSQGEIISDWCAMQTPYETIDHGSYNCAPQLYEKDFAGGARPTHCTIADASGSGMVAADCGWLQRCESTECLCDSESCAARPTFGNASVDSSLENDGNDLVGTLVFRDTEGNGNYRMNRLNVRLTRQP